MHPDDAGSVHSHSKVYLLVATYVYSSECTTKQKPKFLVPWFNLEVPEGYTSTGARCQSSYLGVTV